MVRVSSCGYYGRFLKKPASAAPWDREVSTGKGWRAIFLTLADPEPLPESEPQFSLQSEP